MLFPKEHFDDLRSRVKTLSDLLDPQGRDQIAALFLDLIAGQEKLYRKITEAPIDITKHDEHGRVDLEGD